MTEKRQYLEAEDLERRKKRRNEETMRSAGTGSEPPRERTLKMGKEAHAQQVRVRNEGPGNDGGLVGTRPVAVAACVNQGDLAPGVWLKRW